MSDTKLVAADIAKIVDAIAADAFHEGFGAGIGSVQDEIAEQVAAAEQRGYDKAVANLRDDETALEWMNQGEHRRRFVSPYDRESLARYLEAQRDQP